MTEKQCWTCIYGENRSGSIDCMHSTIRKPVSDDYLADMEKVGRNT